MTEKQEAVLELWLNHPFANYKDIAAKANIGTSTFARWRDNPEFMDEFHKRSKARFAELEAGAMAQLSTLVQDGEWNAVKYVLDGNGYKPTDKVEVQQTNITVSVEDD